MIPSKMSSVPRLRNSKLIVLYQCQSFLVLTIYNGYIWCYHWGKLHEWHAGSLCTIYQLLVSHKLQSYLGTCRLQNSSNPVLIMFWQEKNVSPLSACSGLVTLARICMSRDAALLQKMLHHSVLLGLDTPHEFQNKLTSWLPLYF